MVKDMETIVSLAKHRDLYFLVVIFMVDYQIHGIMAH